jgi:hypothetical protein
VPIAYPVGLPTVLATKRTSKGAAFGMASPRRGTPYVEPTGTDTPTVFAVEWLLSEADAAVLLNWVEVTLERGTLEFTIPLRTETGLREITGNFLPDGLLDRQRDGPLWRYSASIVSRTGTGPLIAPPPPPPPPPPPAPPSGWVLSTWENSVILTAGETGGLVTDEIEQAAYEADLRGYWLALPPWTLRFRRSFRCNKIRGVRGKTLLLPEDTFTSTSVFAQEFVITNRNFSQGFDAAAGDDCEYRDFAMRIGVSRGISGIGLGGTRRSKFEGLQISAQRTEVAGNVMAVGALIDLYCTNRNAIITDCDLANATGAFGADGRIGPDGGACIWVRNFRGGTVEQAEEFASENIRIYNNRMVHMTSDEVLSIYGVTGIVRKVRVYANDIVGLPTIGGVHHNSFISIFPLAFNSGGSVPALDALGATAAVYDNHIYDNDITDHAAMYDVMRIGLASDANNPCYDNKFYNNRVRWVRSADPLTGPKAVWLAEGSPGGVDPDIACVGVGCVDGNFGAAYFNDTSGNTSTDDSFKSSGTAAVNRGFSGWQRLTNPEVLGSVFSGIGNCRFVFGGKVESAGFSFFNCRSVVGTNYRQNLAGGVVFYVNEALGGIYGFKDTVGETFGKMVQLDGAAPSNAVIGVFNNDCQMSTQAGGAGADDYAILENNSSSGATMKVRNNSTRGTSLSITAGIGSIDRASNDWNGTTD